MFAQDLSITEITQEEVEKRHRLADRLKEAKQEILDSWEQKLRQVIPACQELNSTELQDSIPIFIDQVIDRLTAERPFSHAELDELAVRHGDQRSRLPDYDVSQILVEYRMLRKTIFFFLEKEANWATPSSRQVILDTLDEAVEKCTNEFTEHRSMDLRRSNQELEHFAVIAAHDLKSPLATMQGYIDLIKEELHSHSADGTLAKPLDILQRSVTRMNGMISSLLEYSNIETKMKPFEPVSIQDAIERAVESLQIAINESHAKIIFTDEMPQVMGDISLLTQLFLNIFSNAIKFRGEMDPFIYIRVQNMEGFWQFTVEDNGIGFDQKQAERMFEIFKQLSPKHKEKGSGIGLAVCRKVVLLHGGKIWAEAKKEHGARIHFTLPEFHVQ